MWQWLRERMARLKGDSAKESRRDREPVFPFAIATLCVAAWIVCFATGSVVNSQPYRDYLNRAANLEATAAQAKANVKTNGGVAAAPKGDATAAKTAATGAATSEVVTKENLNSAVADAIKSQAPAGGPATTGAYVEQGLSDLFSVFGMLSLFMVVITFTPPNLAMLGALAAVAGAAGRWMMDGVSKAAEAARGEEAGATASVATLRTWASTMMLSALSRGFFVYLAMLSGLLVLTGDPFDKPSPGQYVRLAGTCSLFCFIVGWQPELLTSIIAKFITRVVPDQQVEASKTTVTKKVESTVTQTLEAKKEAVTPAEGGTVNGRDSAKALGEGRVRERVETV